MADNLRAKREVLRRTRELLTECDSTSNSVTLRILLQALEESGKTCFLRLTRGDHVIHEGFVRPGDPWLNFRYLDGAYTTSQVVIDRVAGRSEPQCSHPRDVAALTLLNGLRSAVEGKWAVRGFSLRVE